RLPAAMRARISDLQGTGTFPPARQQASRLAQGRGDQSHPLGNDAEERGAVADGLRLRPSQPVRSRSRKGGSGSFLHRSLQGVGGKGRGPRGGRAQRLWHAAGREIWPQGDVRVLPSSLFLARTARRATGIATAALRILPG